MLIKEIKPIGKVGKNLLDCEDSEKIIETMIEKPMQKACKVFRRKNIVTNMSSANKKNLPKKGTQRKEKQQIKQYNDGKCHFFGPNFTEVGKGYAWLMLDFDKLSNANKEKVFSLENKLGDKAIWRVYSMYYLGFEKEEKEYNEYKRKFDSNALVLVYNHNYPRRAVFLRMPLSNDTTVKEVEDYFEDLAEKFEDQEIC